MIASFVTPAENYDAVILGLKIAAAILATLWFCRTLLDAVEDFRQSHRERNRNEQAAFRRAENLYRVNLYAPDDSPNWPIYPVDLPSDRLIRPEEAKRLAAVIAISDRRRA